MTTTNTPQTLLEAVRYFADLAVCNAYMRRIKWPGGIVCPHCESRRCAERAGGKRIRCKDCRKDFSYRVGTLMEDSALPLSAWFVAIWVAAHGLPVPTARLASLVRCTQKSAWLMVLRIRIATEVIKHGREPQAARLR